MAKLCPKCGYLRTDDDPPPPTECPKCGVIYAKVEQQRRREEEALAAPPPKASDSPTAKLILAAAAAIAVAVGAFVAGGGDEEASAPASQQRTAAASPPAAKPESKPLSAAEYARRYVGLRNPNPTQNGVYFLLANHGKRDLGTVFVTIRGYRKHLVMIPKDEPYEEHVVELTNGPFPAGEKRDTVVRFPDGIITIHPKVRVTDARY